MPASAYYCLVVIECFWGKKGGMTRLTKPPFCRYRDSIEVYLSNIFLEPAPKRQPRRP